MRVIDVIRDGGSLVAAERRAFETDALTAYRRLPLAVVLPRSTEEVSAVMRFLHAQGVKVVGEIPAKLPQFGLPALTLGDAEQMASSAVAIGLLGLLEEAELKARRDAEQMAKTLVGLREALDKVSALNEENWSAETYNVELTRALTAIENARMEWNAARLKWPVLDGALGQTPAAPAAGPAQIQGHFLGAQSFGELCRLGFALTWPVALAVLFGAALLLLLKK